MIFHRITYYCIYFAAGFILQSCQPAESQPIPGSIKHKGVCWVGGREVVTEKEIDALKKNHVLKPHLAGSAMLQPQHSIPTLLQTESGGASRMTAFQKQHNLPLRQELKQCLSPIFG